MDVVMIIFDDPEPEHLPSLAELRERLERMFLLTKDEVVINGPVHVTASQLGDAMPLPRAPECRFICPDCGREHTRGALDPLSQVYRCLGCGRFFCWDDVMGDRQGGSPPRPGVTRRDRGGGGRRDAEQRDDRSSA